MKISEESARAYREKRCEHFPLHSRPRGLAFDTGGCMAAVHVLSEARTEKNFAALEARGLVRLREEPDDCPASEIFGDLFKHTEGTQAEH